MNEINTTANWFESWFDSPYYHLLYSNRDFTEAEFFIQNLVKSLDLSHQEKVLDLACGKGRHAFFLSQFGLDVTGLDLAANSISEAQKLSHKKLHFGVHDMREVYPNQQFDVIFNLFTSFGYFDGEKENIKVLEAIHKMLNPSGKLVIDFMNATKVIRDLVSDEIKTVESTRFSLKRFYDGKHIFKTIDFDAENQHFSFTERVQALKFSDFKKLVEQTGFELENTYGDYALNPFDEENSPRLILIARKK